MVCGGRVMGFRLESLEMHNFKLFAHAVIDAENASLIMLDGPNGYGKTSTFDAMEYLFTGNVQRVSENGISKSNIVFDEDCLIKNPSDGTTAYVKGILYSGEKGRLEITRELREGRGVENNPSKIGERTSTTIVWNGEIICKDETVEKANKEIVHYIGESVLNYYNQFYYIAQEDRLRFLSKSESDRSREIQKLFGIQEEEDNYKKIDRALKIFQSMNKKYSKDVEAKTNDVQKLKEELEGKNNESHIQYKDLVGNEENSPVWNHKHPVIANQEKLMEMAECIRAVGMFSREIELYKKDMKNDWIKERIDDREKLKKYLYLNGHLNDMDALKENMQKYYDIERILKLAETENGDCDYEKYDYEKLKELLSLDLNLEQTSQIKEEIKSYRKNIKEEDEARDSIVKLQEKIKKEWEALLDKNYGELSDSKCPLCGQPYGNKSEVIQKLDTYRQVIENGKGDFQKLIDQKSIDLKKIYDSCCKERIEEYLKQNECYLNDACRQIYKNWNLVIGDHKEFCESGRNYAIPMEYVIGEDAFDQADEIVNEFIKVLEQNKSGLPDEYYSNKEKYQYKNVFSLNYNNQQDKVQYISTEDEHEKILYIEQEYYGSKRKTLSDQEDELEKLRKRASRIDGTEKNLKELKNKVKNDLGMYREKLVNQLKIPFYLYTGRILQNYQGGLGIWMNIIGGERIRFEAEGRQGHDILYTLSSGQLSAVAISIALTLNKIYAQDSIRCVFIDDPIQTMDELNVASFCEVLRTDFKEYQFILSTHEEDFSDYIRYKFEKYGLQNRTVDVQDL